MTRYFMAVTYDVCEHEDFCIDMNEYPFCSSDNIDQQIREFASIDVAPLIKVYESGTSDYKNLEFYKEYRFKDFECKCSQQAI